MTLPSPDAVRPVGYHIDAPAENLLFSAYRCWMAGYATGDAACWDIAWEGLAREMPEENAKPLFGEFHHFVRTLRATAEGELGWRPAACRALCRDECLVLAKALARIGLFVAPVSPCALDTMTRMKPPSATAH